MTIEIANSEFAGHRLKPGRLVSRVDLIVGAAVAVATLAIAVYFAPRGHHSGFVDMAHDGYQLRQALDLSEGGVTFRDTFDQYGPLNGYLNTVGFLALGRRLLAMKYFICGWYALIAVLLYAMARRWLTPLLAGFSTVVWLGLAPFYQHGIMISPHVYVLFFQALAAIVALSAPRLEWRRYALVGLLAGLSWSMKQSMGVLFLASILAYLACRLIGRDRVWSRVATAATASVIGFFTVAGVVLAFLWTRGALHDWYLQSIVFPRELYLVEYGRKLTSSLFTMFITMQLEQPVYWMVIRIAVIVAGLAQLLRRQRDADLVLMATITAILWAGAFPSANFMHQWWTASLAIAPFVFSVRTLLTRVAKSDAALSMCTIALVLAVTGEGLAERVQATTVRASSLSETIERPPVFRGIRTDPPTKRAFETLYDTMSRYRTHHPGAGIRSIDSADAYWTGINESLPFLSALDGNTHSQPVYWSLPALTTTVYPQYDEHLWKEIRAEHPLLIEHREGAYKSRSISEYVLLAAVQSDVGNWYVYGHDNRDRVEHGEASIYLARDGKTESGFAEHGGVPRLARRLSSHVEAAWRGRVAASPQRGERAELPGAFPFVLHDQLLANASRPINVYTWPSDLPMASLEGAIERTATVPVARADIVRDLKAGAWTVDGYAQGQYAYLLKFAEAPIAAGTYLVVRGELQEGGFTVGLTEHDKWSTYVNVTRPGLFEAVLQIEKPGRYALTVANCLEEGWWQRGWRYRLRNALGFARVGPNRFRVTEAGWMQPVDRPQ